MYLGNEILVSQIDLGIKSPKDTRARIKTRYLKDGEEKERQQKEHDQQSVKDNICYFDWLEENYITDFEFRIYWQTISFTFVNLDDAMAFKLRWL